MKLNPKELNKLLEQVSDDVAAVLAKAEESEKTTLAKADPGEEAPGEETPAGSSTEGSAPAPEADPSEAPEAPAGDAGPAADAPAPEAAPGDEQTQNPAEDESAGPEALVAEYSKLPIEELKMHVMASHAALMQSIGGGDGQEAGPEGAAPEAPAPEAPGAAPEATQPAGTEEPPIGKAEIKANPSNGGKIIKSQIETRLATLEKSLKEKNATIQALETKFGEATEGLKKLVEKSGNVALRKSIAGISFQGKPGDSGKQEVRLSKSEAVKQLNELTASSDLKKSDRALITQYVIGTTPQSTISHLLK
jgi:hypothetical protein